MRRIAFILTAGSLLGTMAALKGDGMEASWGAVAVIAAIAGATLISEDLTCIATGLLIHRGELSPVVGVAGCFIGIFAGDVALWLVGRLLGTLLGRWGWMRRRLPQQRLRDMELWLDRHAGKAILASRFVPGTRLPMYIAAGALGRRAGRFVLWALIAAAIWTPALVLLTAWLGEALVVPIEALLGSSLWSLAAAAIALFVFVRLLLNLLTPIGRAKLIARFSKLWRYEFWPAWIFYAPLVPYIAWLSLRHRGFITITAANPGIPHGGFVGESKHDILAKLPREHLAPFVLIPPGEVDQRFATVGQLIERDGWSFPLILKPDAGQRGVGVKLARSIDDVRTYFITHTQPVLAQAYAPGPFEAGVFYYRIPGEPRGHILSITDKHFPILTGDGTNTLEELIWRHPRFRMQAATFLTRHAAQRGRVLAAGETMTLTVAGNHCQGAEFRDGSHLITPALEAAIDAIATQYEGFYFGRFDVRYEDAHELKAGRRFTIIELNGVTSESTNLYDPTKSLWFAYRTLFRQWSLLFRIASLNRRQGHAVSAWRQLWCETRAHYRDRTANLIAD